MPRFKACICLVLSMFSTLGTFASVHECKGEVTDIGVLSMASCSHEKESNWSEYCEMTCCTDEDDHMEDKGCCKTQNLTTTGSFITPLTKAVVLTILVRLSDFSDFQAEEMVGCLSIFPPYPPPILERDILMEVQFLI